MKPLLNYYGGKQKLSSLLVTEFSKIPHQIYAVPFAGGLSDLYAKPVPVSANKASYIECINDNNEMLMTLYRVARANPQELFEAIQWTPYSKAEYNRSLEIYRGEIESTDLEKAWAVFVACHFSFSHRIGGGWRYGRKGSNVASQWQLSKKRLELALSRLKEVHIDCCDALNFIDRWDSPSTLFYCDPPYPGANQGHYAGYSETDFLALCQKLDEVRGSYVLSNYEQATEPLSATKKVEIKITCTASGQGRTRTSLASKSLERTEILWVCDRSPTRSIQQTLDLSGAIAP